MGELQSILDEQIRNAPRLLLRELLAGKIAAADIYISDFDLDALVDHISAGHETPFRWDDGQDHEVQALEIDDADLEKLDAAAKRFTDSFPELVESITESTSASLLKTLKRRWKKEWSEQAEIHQGFRDRLEDRWKKPLGLLRMLLTIAREFGPAAFSGATKGQLKKHKHLRKVLLRLHVRACQVTAEIITLLENGFADGAMARWRTLHEIGVVITFISEAGEETAERYIEHHKVEAKNGLGEYLRCYEAIGYKPMSQKAIDRINQRFDAVIARYGAEFATPYGWAAARLGKKRPLFSQLEDEINRSEMRSHYKLASYNVHAGPHGAFFRLGLIGDAAEVLLAGASNAGLSEPGQNTAHTLTQISAVLLGENRDLDQIVALKVMQELRLQIPVAFAKAEAKLARDEKKFQRGDFGG